VVGERADRSRRRHGGGHRDDQYARHRSDVPEAQRGPDQRREHQEQQVIGTGGHRDREDERDGDQRRQLQPPDHAQVAEAGGAQHQEEGDDHEDAHHVAGPPHRPRLPVLPGRHPAPEDHSGGAGGRADHRAAEGAQEDQRHGVAQPIQFEVEAGASEQQTRAQRGDRVAHGDHRDRRDRRPERQVDHERREGDPGARPGAEEQKADDGDADRQPQGRDVAVHGRQPESQLGGRVVRGGGDEDSQDHRDGVAVLAVARRIRGRVLHGPALAPLAPPPKRRGHNLTVRPRLRGWARP
jgi:hypothetical protein